MGYCCTGLKMIPESRRKRYSEKLELAEERLQDAEELLHELSDKIKKLACYKAFQELVESLFNVISMFLKDSGKEIEDDYTNLDKFAALVNLTENEIKVLKDANGLRNRLVHKYNRTDDLIAKESMEFLLPHLQKIIEKFKELVGRNGSSIQANEGN